jgi:hypothetical protein
MIFRHVRSSILLVATFAGLLATSLVPGLLSRSVLLESLLSSALGVGLLVWTAPVLRRTFSRSGSHRRKVRRFVRSTVEMLAQLSPVALLTLVFPIASHHLGATSISGVRLTALLLASSLTVPWLSQSVCLPLYRAIGEYVVAEGDERARRFWAVWPCVWLHALPPVALFAGTVEAVMRWPIEAFGTYVGLCLAHVAFAQALVIANIERRRARWAIAWTAYAASLFLVPRLWFLPPLLGMLTQLVPISRHVARIRKPIFLDRVEVQSDLLRGLLLGTVLWADKWLFFLREGNRFAVNTVFFALLPAVLAYNYYFVRLSPGFDASVSSFRKALENEAFSKLPEWSRTVTKSVTTSVQRTGLLGALLVCALALELSEHSPETVHLAVPVAVASWLFMMITVLSYKLDYVGRRLAAQSIGALHLALCALLFVVMTPGAALYTTLAGAELGLFVGAYGLCVLHWRTPEYTLFWRHATAW